MNTWYNYEVIFMMKLFKRSNLKFFIMFVSLFSISLYTDIYTRSILDIDSFGFNVFHCRTLWIGFSLSWIALVLLIIYLLPNGKRIKVFSILNIIFVVLLFSQICYVQQLGKYMVVSDLFLAGEGLQYVKSIFLNLDIGMILAIIFSLACVVLLNFIEYKVGKDASEENADNRNPVVIGILIFIVFTMRLTSYVMLGHDVEKNNWQENYNTKNIYNNFTNPNSAMFVSGFYEYHVRAIFKYIYNLVTLDKQKLKTSVDKYNSIYGMTRVDNAYTGIFKDKNVIYIMMESIDSWIIDEDTMPTLKYMMDTGLNFTNRYSPFFNGGQTINSEFALNSGMYAISDQDTIYDIDNVDYTYSLANVLKNNGYRVNSFHANSANFYNRGNFHKWLGYDNHYSAVDMQKSGVLSKNKNYFVDSEFISEDVLYNYFTYDEKYMSFMTTYSAHLEYTPENKVFKSVNHSLAKKKYGEEEYIYRTLAHDTDKFLSILLERLESDKKLDDVVIVLVSDHYVYGYSDVNYVAHKKETVNDRKDLQKTPFIIWSKDIEHKDIDIILDTADILPTMLNMLGIEYDPNNYLGDDVFSENHDDFVWFADGTYIKSDKCLLSNEAILTKTNYNISKNKAILLTNYYGKQNE